MKKIISSILIVITLMQLFAPFGVVLKDRSLVLNKNIANAAGLEEKNITHKIVNSDTKVTVYVKYNFDGTNIIAGGIEEYSVMVTVKKDGDKLNSSYITMKSVDANNSSGYTTFSDLKPSTTYGLTIQVFKSETQQIGAVATSSTTYLYNKEASFTTNAAGQQSGVSSGEETANLKEIKSNAPGVLPACGLGSMGEEGGTMMGCLAQGLYYLFFKTTSWLFGWAGTFLDFTLMYSISDTSYRSPFVTEGWGIVRDFCNMFFIFVLLYVAFGTILSLNGVKTKEMIVHVVIIGILINFSLFATQIIIDASNILTRVFYNQNTIVTGVDKDSSGKVVSELGEFGQIKLSEAIISKVDPQELIIRASEIDSIPIRGTQDEGDTNKNVSEGGISVGSFILIIILATAVNVVGITVFFSSGLIFVVRVITLWLAMILAPLAFFSYTIPEFSNMKTIGFKHWWSDTLSMAFLAPVFAFFMYIIVGFMDKGLGIIDAATKKSSAGLGLVVAIVVPFVFIMALLDRARKIAKDMSGEVAGEIMKKAESIGKTALSAGGTVAGGALGMGAGLLRGTVGNLGNKLANSKFASTTGAPGRVLGNLGKWASEGSMDIRGVKIAGKSLSGIKGMKSIGNAGGQGGYKKYAADKIAKKQQRAKELEVHENEDLMQNLYEKEESLQKIKNKFAADLAAKQGMIDAGGTDAREKKERADNLDAIVKNAGSNATAQQIKDAADAREAAKEASDKLQKAKDEKLAIRNGAEIKDKDGNPTGKYYTTNGNMTKDAMDKAVENTEAEAKKAEAEATAKEALAVSIEADATYSQADKEQARREAEDAKELLRVANEKKEAAIKYRDNTEAGESMFNLEVKDIPAAKRAISEENSKRKNDYADDLEDKLFNKKINRSASHRIRMDSEIKSEVKK